MNVHLVFAHPEPRSFCAALKDTTVAALSGAGHDVVVSDLYADGFDPVASAADFPVRRDPDYLNYALEQRHAIEHDALAPDIEREVTRVRRAELLVLVFPVFWFSVPAILKGWIERVFLSGPFYGGRRFYGRGGMSGRRALVIATMGARPHMFGPDAIHGEIEAMFRHLHRGTLGYVGYDVLEPFRAFHVPYVSDEERRRTIADLRDHLGRLETLPVLPMPDLDDYDAVCRPLHRSR